MKNKPLLDETQLDKISDLCLGLGQIIFASMVLPFAVQSVDKPTFEVLLFGLGFAIAFWIFAVWIVKKR